jgi:hypothetical protein
MDDLEKALRLAPYYRDEVEKDVVFAQLREGERYRKVLEGESDEGEDEIDLGIDAE